MHTTISSAGQTRWKNSYASSSEARLNLRVNGEEKGVVITRLGEVVSAGFVAPSVAPSAAATGAGNVPAGFYHYVYVYASSAYPYVPSAITGGGLEYPRSNPSPAGSYNNAGAQSVNVVCTTSNRQDVTSIWVYRTLTMTTAALALAEANAGRYYYVGSVGNSQTSSTVIYVDNNATDTGESLELDNYPCPLFRFTVFDGTYWWGFGNSDFSAVISMDATADITISDGDNWFSGRDGLTCKITGLDTGGFDGQGTYYFKSTGPTTCNLYTNADLSGTAASFSVTGTATMRIFTNRATLYRSKRMNPFAWGRTTQVLSAGGEDVNFVSDTWAEVVGGGTGTAISLIPNEGILKVDTESPVKSYALDLAAADSDQFMGTKRTLDEAQSVSSHFSQFPMRLSSKQSVATGVNSKAFQILMADAQSQVPIGDNVIRTLRNMRASDDAPHFFHGVFDYGTELNCWFIKTTDGPWKCDTMIYRHAATGSWGLKYWPALSASAAIFDPVSGQHITLVGDEWGNFGRAFYGTTDFLALVTSSPTPTSSIAAGVGTMVFPFFTIDIFSISSTGGISTITTSSSHGLAEGEIVFIGGTISGNTEGNYIVKEIISSTVFTIYERNSTGATSSDTGGGVGKLCNVYEIPAAIVENSGIRMWIVDSMTIDSTSYDGFTDEMTVNFTGIGGINMDTGSREVINSSSVTYYPGAIPCVAGRFFNAGNPERGKRNNECWVTANFATDLNRWRFHQEYDEGISLINITPENDSAQTSVWFTRAIPETIYNSFGMDFINVGYSSFRILDFTLKPSNA